MNQIEQALAKIMRQAGLYAESAQRWRQDACEGKAAAAEQRAEGMQEAAGILRRALARERENG